MKLPRMRKINEAVAELKKLDPGCAITPHFLRQRCREGASYTTNCNGTYLINLDKFIEALSNNSWAA